MGLRESGKTRRRRRILEEARQLIEQEGLDALSMRRLAEASELSTRTLYNLYGAKETIVFALLEEGFEDLDRTLKRLGPADPLDRSRALIVSGIESLSRHAHLHRSVMRELDRNPQRAREISLLARVRALHEETLRAAIYRGLIDPSHCPRVIAHQILMGFAQALRLWARDMLDLEALRAQALHVWAVQLLAVASDASRARLRAQVLELEGGVKRLIDGLDQQARGAPRGAAMPSGPDGPRPAAAGASAGSAGDRAPARHPARAHARD